MRILLLFQDKFFTLKNTSVFNEDYRRQVYMGSKHIWCNCSRFEISDGVDGGEY